VQQLSRLQLVTQTNSEKVFHITLQAAKKMAQIGAKGFDFPGLRCQPAHAPAA